MRIFQNCVAKSEGATQIILKPGIGQSLDPVSSFSDLSRFLVDTQSEDFLNKFLYQNSVCFPCYSYLQDMPSPPRAFRLHYPETTK